MKSKLLDKYKEGASLIALDRGLLHSYFKSKPEAGTLTLIENIENGKSITFNFTPSDNRTDNYVLYIPILAEGGYKIIRSRHILNQKLPSFGCLLNNPKADPKTYDWISGTKIMCKGTSAYFYISLPAGYKAASSMSTGTLSYFVSTSSGMKIIERFLTPSGTSESGKYEIKALADGSQTISIQLIDCNGNALTYTKNVWVGQVIEVPEIKRSMVFVPSPSSTKTTAKGSRFDIHFYLAKMPEGANAIQYTIYMGNQKIQSGISTSIAIGKPFYIPITTPLPCFKVEVTAYNTENKTCYPNIAGTSSSFNSCGKKPQGGSTQGHTDDDFEVYPNPVNDVATLKWNVKDMLSPSDDVSITITDLQGRNVYSQTLPKIMYNLQINTSEYNSGMYFVKFKMGSLEVVKKLNIQHR